MIGVGTGYDKTFAKLLNPQAEYLKGRRVVKRMFVFFLKLVASKFLVALRSDGLVFASGYNNYGQLGDNSTVDKKTYVQAVSP